MNKPLAYTICPNLGLVGLVFLHKLYLSTNMSLFWGEGSVVYIWWQVCGGKLAGTKSPSEIKVYEFFI
jgi:hypothetical protein